MKNSNAPAVDPEENGHPAGGKLDLDLEFPDWSGMLPHNIRMTYQEAAEHNRQLRMLYPPKPDEADRRLAVKIPVEFILN